MADLVDVQDLGSCGEVRVGSSPTARTKGGKFVWDLPPFFHTATAFRFKERKLGIADRHVFLGLGKRGYTGEG